MDSLILNDILSEKLPLNFTTTFGEGTIIDTSGSGTNTTSYLSTTTNLINLSSSSSSLSSFSSLTSSSPFESIILSSQSGVFDYQNQNHNQAIIINNNNNNNITTNIPLGIQSTVSLLSSLTSSSFAISSASSFTPTTAITSNNNLTELPSVGGIIVSIILLIIILGTIIGNVLVCIAVCLVRKLRRPCNYLLVSLAVSDLCVAILVMPTALLYEISRKWNFGELFCDIWVSFDVLCCTASILNLCAISVDRYWAITKPLEYGVKRTPNRMMLCVVLVWLAAACISLPPLFVLGNEHIGDNGELICMVCQNFGYQIYATLGSFYIPLSVMLFVYYQIFRAARRIVKDEKQSQNRLKNALNNGTTKDQKSINMEPTITTTTDSTKFNTTNHSNTRKCTVLGSPHQKKLRFQLAKERKASTTLGIIMSAFTICWLPFFILALIRPFVEKENRNVIPETLGSLFLWLGYANSLLNPIIYATLNRDFRKPFQEILYFRCSSLNTMMREDFYQSQYGEPPLQRVVICDEGQGIRESFL